MYSQGIHLKCKRTVSKLPTAMAVALWSLCLAGISCLGGFTLKAQELAFPGAQGWAADTPGGRGGKIIRVTNLDADGPTTLAFKEKDWDLKYMVRKKGK